MDTISLTCAIKKYHYGKFVNEILPIPNEFKISKKQYNIKYNPINSKVSSLVGTSYDYLLRIYLFKKYRNKIQLYGSDGIETISSKKFLGGFICQKGIRIILPKLSYSHTADKYYDSMDIILEYIDNNNASIDDNLLEAIVFISNFDAVYRSKYINHLISEKWKTHIKDAIVDLKNLISTIPDFENKINFSNHIYLNLATGYVNKYISKSDCDLIIDDTLIDIKTTKDISFTSNEYAQLIGYYIATKKYKININKIGIYYTRYDILHLINIKDLKLDNEKLIKLNNWIPKQN